LLTLSLLALSVALWPGFLRQMEQAIERGAA
jgi:hypothetical protein